MLFFFFFSSRRRHTRWPRDWSSDVCSSDLLEVGSPDRAVNMVLELRGEGTHGQAEVPEHLPTSNVMFRCDDLPATHRELAARGVEFPQPPVQQPFGWWSMFNDTEGNRFALDQTVPETS